MSAPASSSRSPATESSARYVSTRGRMPVAHFCDVLLGGLAPDGGLVVPQQYPRLTAAELAGLRNLSYADLACAIIGRFIDDIPEQDLRTLVHRAYRAEVFGSAEITPLQTLEPGLHLLKLSNGPTLAFKDVAMQLLGELFEYVLKRQGRTLNILGATSGDTGSAAEYAMRGRKGIRVFMLSPHGKMSPFQRAQMYSLQDANIFNIAIRGVFDECQDIVKAVSNDAAFKSTHRIGAVNSINWARVVAQVVYYFKGYFAATSSNDEQVSFAVPSGNFGNIFAGHIARMMGLPVRHLILASNENDVLDEFFRSGRYRVRSGREVAHTSSPSMDISKASNFERFVFDLVGRDPVMVARLWREVEDAGGFNLGETPFWRDVAQYGLVSGRSTHQNRIETIRSIHKKYDVTIDPHTADGVYIGLQQRENGVPLICMETALPAKFAETIREALGHDPDVPPGYEGLQSRLQRVTVMDPDVEAVKTYIVSRTK
ncbi:MAG: threonine synthase [Betaproteobacteria bacterium]|nr:threonine synthase [Betaproteobacteria bacterium]MDH5341617.1 threonine synthase [Betaproteobacteria bacterium]